MKCPTCGARAATKETREVEGTIERRRHCDNGHRIITRETFYRNVGEKAPKVVTAAKAEKKAKAVAKVKKKLPPATHWPMVLPGTPNRVVTPTGPRLVSKPPKPIEGPAYTHNAKVQCAPGEQPFGAGFAAVGIGRNVDTGRGW